MLFDTSLSYVSGNSALFYKFTRYYLLCLNVIIGFKTWIWVVIDLISQLGENPNILWGCVVTIIIFFVS